MFEVSSSDLVVVKVKVDEDIEENLVDIVVSVVLAESEVEVWKVVEVESEVGGDVMFVEGKVWNGDAVCVMLV